MIELTLQTGATNLCAGMKRLTRASFLIVLAWTLSAARTEPGTQPSGRLGDLLITLSEVDDPADQAGHVEANDRHEVLINGTVRNVGKKPICSTLDASLGTSSNRDEFAATTLAGQNDASIRELLPGQTLAARFVASVNNRTDLLTLRISQSEPDQGCSGHRHHISKAALIIPLADLPKIQNPPSSSVDSSEYVGEVLTVSGAVSAPRIKYQTEPEFSEEGRKAGHHGTVIIRAIVGTDGRVHDPRILRSQDHMFDQRALQAVSQWIFDPAMKDGRIVPVFVDVEVGFQLY